MKTRKELADELVGTTCQCGARKKERQTFCGPCYRRLPSNQRKALYRRFGEGYEQAYEEAHKTLTTPAQ